MPTTQLAQDIWALNAEDQYQTEDIDAQDHGRRVFRRYCEHLLALFGNYWSETKQGFVAIAGLEQAAMQIAATMPENAALLGKNIPRAITDQIFSKGGNFRLLSQAENSQLPAPLVLGYERLVMKLAGSGEFFGILCLDLDQDSALVPERMVELNDVWRAISRCVSDAVFSMRLEALAAPFSFKGNNGKPDEEIYEQICRQATLGFAADGGILRIFDERTSQLVVRGKWGNVTHNPEEDGSPAERICNHVFRDTIFGTARTIETGKGFGVEITPEDEESLRIAGVGSYMVVRLQSDIAALGVNARIGTLSIFHYRVHEFSLRDIRLFRAYSERIADDLALITQMKKLEEMSTLMRSQFNVLTRAEVISLLAHDVGHKAIRASERVEDLIDAVKKALREKQSFNSISHSVEEAKEACARVENELAQIKQITRHVDEEAVQFTIKEVCENIRRDFSSVLDRVNMTMEVIMQGNSSCYGARSVFEQVIFNLVINSIDAQKSLRHPRKNIIHIHCREDKTGPNRKLILQFWDEGPGISFPHFPEANEIFVLGRTSKPEGQGTGTGLPMSRSLLDKYFRGDLILKDRQKAFFEIQFEPAEKPKS